MVEKPEPPLALETDPEPLPLRRPAFWRTRCILSGVGLALFVVCLVALLGSGPLTMPDWFRWNRRPTGPIAVIIDPGHGGGDTGAVAQGVVEKDLNLDVGRRVAKLLQDRGIAVQMTREDDRFIPLASRVRMGNALPGAIFVSIHFNDSPGSSSASGIETYYSGTRSNEPASGWHWASLVGNASSIPTDECVRESQRLADCIQGALVVGVAAADRGIKERALYVTRRVQAPSVLVEGGFVSHPAEARRLGDPAYRQRLAKFIADGIVTYLAAVPRRAGGHSLAAR